MLLVCEGFSDECYYEGAGEDEVGRGPGGDGGEEGGEEESVGWGCGDGEEEEVLGEGYENYVEGEEGHGVDVFSQDLPGGC